MTGHQLPDERPTTVLLGWCCRTNRTLKSSEGAVGMSSPEPVAQGSKPKAVVHY